MVEVIVVSVLLSIMTVAISYSMMPILRRTQAEFLEATLVSEISTFQTILTRDLRNARSATKAGDRLLIETTFERGAYVTYSFEPNGERGAKVVRRSYNNAGRTNLEDEVTLVSGAIQSWAFHVLSPDNSYNSFTMSVDFFSGAKDITVSVWSRAV